MERVLFVAHTDGEGALGKGALEGLAAALELAPGGSGLDVAILGANAAAAAETLGSCGAERFLIADSPDLAVSRYATDTAALAELVRCSGAEIVIAAASSRFSRCMPGVAHRCGGRIDTQVSALEVVDDQVQVERWYYRQRMFARFSRQQRPWFILVAGGIRTPWQGEAQSVSAQSVSADSATRTQVVGREAPDAQAQTIRPEAELLLVAGAGWTKKQADGQTHGAEAGALILELLERSRASLGSSKSLVDQGSEGQEVLEFMSHLNQIGQTGSTPRHAKGLSTCCHGEEPHVVGWRFIGERRAVNLDPNCGWAQGKADVLYVADAFQVVAKLNQLLAAE